MKHSIQTCYEQHNFDEICVLVCKNCKGGHSSNFKGCPALKEEVEILKVKESYSVSYFDAKSIFKSNTDQLEGAQSSHTKTFQELYDENKKLVNDLRSARQENRRIVEERNNIAKKLNHVEHDILPQLNRDLEEAYDKINRLEITIKDQEHSMQESVKFTQDELGAANSENLIILQQNEELKRENTDLKVVAERYSKLMEEQKKKEDNSKIFADGNSGGKAANKPKARK